MPWTARQVLVLMLVITTLELSVSYKLQPNLQNPENFLLWSSIDALIYLLGVTGFVVLGVKGSLEDLGLHLRTPFKAILAGLGTGALTSCLVLLAGRLLQLATGQTPQVQVVQEIIEKSAGLENQLLVLAVSCVLIPLKEEIVFRGLMYPAFRARVGTGWGIIVTSVVFSFAHGSLPRAVPLLLGGIALNMVCQRTGSLYSSIIAHGVWNGVMSMLTFWIY